MRPEYEVVGIVPKYGAVHVLLPKNRILSAQDLNTLFTTSGSFEGF